jgi:molybdate/tungstate transport system ATP-binding protein
MFEMQGICKRLGAFALDPISLQLKAGEYFVLLGPTGVGKTVLLELIAGLLRPDSGRLYWQGCDITDLPPERRNFGLVYQDFALFEHLTVASNIGYGLRTGGTARRDAQRQAGDIASVLGISHLLNRRPATLSGGEQQRVALARALVTKPRMLLLDEPLSALDLNVRTELRRLLRETHHANTTTTFFHVTHDVDEALYLADRVGVMLDSRLQQTGTPEQVFQHPSDRGVADFLGLKNVLIVDRVRDGQCVVDGVKLYVPGGDRTDAHFWIRPEEILLSAAPFDSSARNQFQCRVIDWEHAGRLLAVRVAVDQLMLTAMVTQVSFRELGVAVDGRLYCTFKSSALHCLEE